MLVVVVILENIVNLQEIRCANEDSCTNLVKDKWSLTSTLK